jgi:hypothetical protein
MTLTKRLVTCCNGDVHNLKNWLHLIDFPFIIYHKSDALQKGEYNKINNFETVIPNYGRCEYAFLLHIINNYDTLDDVTIFTKSNWEYEHLDLFGVIQRSPFYDYVNGGNHRIYQIWRKDASRTNIPLGWPEKNIEQYYEPAGKGIGAYEMYDMIFPKDISRPDVIKGVGHGPCISVKKEIIRRWSISVYKNMLDMFHIDINSINPADESLVKNSPYFHNEWIRFFPVFFTHNLECTKSFY